MNTPETMELRPGHRISRVIKGGWQLAGDHGDVDRPTAIADMKAFVEAGIVTFDCADIYPGVEEMIGDFIDSLRRESGANTADRVVVHTKLVPDLTRLTDLRHDEVAAVGAKVAADQGYKTIAILYKNDDWGQDLNNLISRDFAALGIKVTEAVAINDAQPSYRAEVTQALSNNPDALYLGLYPAEGTAAVREWLSLGGTQNMIMANSLKSDDFRENVGLQYLGKALGTDTASPRVASADAFVTAYKERFDSEPNGPGLANSYDAAMIALLAMEAAGKGATGDQIAAAVRRITGPNGTPVAADAAGFTAARAALANGGNVMYQGATGNVRFDTNGDVSAPAVVWKFNASGTEEVQYLSLTEVDDFITSLN
ncbi:MAG: hypothetical protein CL532_09545 [Aestuariivita sp.]|nr:hypothetical protein [Aestuariivita sp.]